MSDRELLMAAAKAAGLKVIIPAAHQRGLWIEGLEDEWNPLTDDGDALRLAVKLKLNRIEFMAGYSIVTIHMTEMDLKEVKQQMATMIHERQGKDPYAATRRAIVRAAAEIGAQNGN